MSLNSGHLADQTVRRLRKHDWTTVKSHLQIRNFGLELGP
jgi:hypothetical protein